MPNLRLMNKVTKTPCQMIFSNRSCTSPIDTSAERRTLQETPSPCIPSTWMNFKEIRDTQTTGATQTQTGTGLRGPRTEAVLLCAAARGCCLSSWNHNRSPSPLSLLHHARLLQFIYLHSPTADPFAKPLSRSRSILHQPSCAGLSHGKGRILCVKRLRTSSLLGLKLWAQSHSAALSPPFLHSPLPRSLLRVRAVRKQSSPREHLLQAPPEPALQDWL